MKKGASMPVQHAVTPEQPGAALLDHQQSAVDYRFDDAGFLDAGDVIVGHWECQICGERHLGPLPAACEACGADRRYLVPEHIRVEMTSR